MKIEKVQKPLRTLFVGFQDQDNLGQRYLMSAANAAGHETKLITFTADPTQIVECVLQYKPDFIGFSLIFQFMTATFLQVIKAVRQAGCTCHISVGGHFPSFDAASVLEGGDDIDSIVRFEGEATLLRVLECLGSNRDWRKLRGIAFKADDGLIVQTPLRPQVACLDDLPWPKREDIRYEDLDMPTASIIGSRGCPWNCEFCSIRPFYEAQEGKLRRLRSPKDVVDEMRQLYHQRNVALFLFQDDDFLATGARARKWAIEIADRIYDSDIGGKVAWKISCRSDEIRADVLERLIRGGLTHVYLGVESGDEKSLINMGKQMGPERHLQAGKALRDAGLSFDFGFMLLDPWSDIRAVRANIDFLDTFVGDGWSVASFCRMLPYSGTPIERRLRAEDRLFGTYLEPDYRFLDPKLDRFFGWVMQTFHKRNFTNQGIAHILRATLFESRIKSGTGAWMRPEETRWLQYIAARANRSATTSLRQAIDHIDATELQQISVYSGVLADITRRELQEQAELTALVDDFWNDAGRQARRKAAHGRAHSEAHSKALIGGFENTWTSETPKADIPNAAQLAQTAP